MKRFLYPIMWTMLLFTAWALVSCSDDETTTELPTQVEAPEIIQSEEISDNPITLAFSWEVVDNAESYSYVLAAVKESGNETIAQGNTTELNIEIVSTREAELFYSTEYLFSIKAIAEDKTESAASEVRVTTSGGAIALSIENLTYRSALLKGVPVDKSMLYQFAQIPIEKYLAYDSDMEFIEGYDYGYYQAMGAAMPWIPWYSLMQEGSQQGDYTYHTKILKPETDYLLYAYGVEFDTSDTENPVSVITPLIKYPFTTPAWKATSNCTFDISIESQEIDQDGYIVINVKVVPSDNSVRYYVAFPTRESLETTYANDIYDYAFAAVYNKEIYSSVEDWSTSEYLTSGEAVVTSSQFGWSINPQTEYRILVFGVDGNGLVTTEIASVDCTSIAE